MTPVFFDTWGWVALAHAGDSHHRRASRWYDGFLRSGGAIVTSDVVLVETLQVLSARCRPATVMNFAAGVERSVVQGDVHVLVASPEVLAVALRLFVRLNGPGQRRSRRPARMISLADCTSMTLMQSAGLRTILTGDEHFVLAGLGFELVEIG